MSGVPARPRGVARRPWRVADYASLDFETTGLDLNRDQIISFGVVPIHRGRIVLGGSTYREVQPVANLKPESIVIHGIRPIDLATAPQLDLVEEDLRDALSERFVIAWAAEIEASFLARTFGRRASWWRRRIIDGLQLAMLVDRFRGIDEEDYTLSAVASRLAVPVEQPHHALDDALTTAQIFLMLLPELERQGIGTPRRLLRASRQLTARR
jgi:DNA polymerase III subunit epsilon